MPQSEPRAPPVCILWKASIEIEDAKGELYTYTLRRDDSHATYLAYRVVAEDGPSAGDGYECRQYAGEQRCTCKDSTCRKRVCKHLQALQQLGAFRPQEELLAERSPAPVARPLHPCQRCGDGVDVQLHVDEGFTCWLCADADACRARCAARRPSLPPVLLEVPDDTAIPF